MKNRVAEFLSPVYHIPGHRQHAGHPGAAHHPATHKQSGDVDSLQAENSADVEVDWLHDILKVETQTSAFNHRQNVKSDKSKTLHTVCIHFVFVYCNN